MGEGEGPAGDALVLDGHVLGGGVGVEVADLGAFGYSGVVEVESVMGSGQEGRREWRTDTSLSRPWGWSLVVRSVMSASTTLPFSSSWSGSLDSKD